MAHFIIYQKCPFKGQLFLAGYAQSSVPGKLNAKTGCVTMENYLSQNLKFFQKIDFVLIRLNHLIFVFYRNDQETSFQYF